MRNKSLVSILRKLDPDQIPGPACAIRIYLDQAESELPVHHHRKGQLILALHGGLTCKVPGSLWMVPPLSAVWIPGGMPHSSRVTSNAQICFLFVEPRAAKMPTECCTLSISSLVREMILHLADLMQARDTRDHTRMVKVLLDELTRMPVENLHLPISSDRKLQRIADALTAAPADRRAVEEWGKYVAMSGRSLARLIMKETGMTFGQWRQQLHLIVALHHLSEGASVQQVSSDIGYESVTAFITMFKKALGTTPARYFAKRI
jgi:AraC-like DNA-binding protein